MPSEILEHVSAGEVVKADSELSIGINFTVFSFVIVVPYLYVMLLLLSKTGTFDIANSICLEIFGFIRLDSMCFSNRGLVQYSVN